MGSLEKHVLKKVGKPGSQVVALMNAPAFDPRLDTDHGIGQVLLEDDGQTVVKGHHLGGVSKKGFE
jgi:hypothetical protein